MREPSQDLDLARAAFGIFASVSRQHLHRYDVAGLSIDGAIDAPHSAATCQRSSRLRMKV
jgi:hypothetical protein